MRVWLQTILVGLGVVAALGVGAGCGGADLSRHGGAAYQEQVQRLKSEIAQDPGDAPALRELGETYLRAGRPARAYETLKDAFARTPGDPETRFYLALAAESVGKRSSARDLYGQYHQVADSSPFRLWMQGRSLWLSQQQVREDIRSTLAQDDVRQRPVAMRTVAVLPMACRSSRLSGGSKVFGRSAATADIGWGLAAVIVNDLEQVRGIRPVPLQKVQGLLREVAPRRVSVADPASVPHAGRLLGAGHVVGGRCERTGAGSLQVSLQVTRTTGGAFGGVTNRQGSISSLFHLQGALVVDLATQIGATLTPEERTAVAQIPTEHLGAFQAYGSGLVAETRERYDDATTHFRRAHRLDSSFTAPERALNRVRALEKAAGPWKQVLPRTAAITAD